jgi:hypothetical protein
MKNFIHKVIFILWIYSKCDFISDKNYVDETYQYIQNIENIMERYGSILKDGVVKIF